MIAVLIIIIVVAIFSGIVFYFVTRDHFSNINTNMYNFLKTYKNKSIIYVPNTGNAGDSLIAYGTFLLFKKVGLKYTIGNCQNTYTDKILFYAGGGSLIGIYGTEGFFYRNHQKNEIVLLPHTVKDLDKMVLNFGNNVKIFCRERRSFDYVYNIIRNKQNVFLTNDMAFYITGLEKYKKKKGKGVINCYRTDVEKTNLILPPDNRDLSQTLIVPNNTSDPKIVEEVSLKIFDILSEFEVINTNRLHLAIAGSLIGKKVNFYGNNYYKNEAVYEYSLKKQYPKTVFHF